MYISARKFVSTLTVATALSTIGLGATSYTESGSGLSDLPDSPTGLTFTPGDNEVHGTTGRGLPTAPPDRDFFSFSVPAGFRLSSLEVLSDTTSAGATGISFIGLVAAADFGPTIPTAASALLGYRHYSPGDIGTDILGELGSAPGATGFTPPLGAGTYAVWIQETAPGSSTSYGFNFRITAVPDSGPGIGAAFAILGLTLAAGVRRRNS